MIAKGGYPWTGGGGGPAGGREGRGYWCSLHGLIRAKLRCSARLLMHLKQMIAAAAPPSAIGGRQGRRRQGGRGAAASWACSGPGHRQMDGCVAGVAAVGVATLSGATDKHSGISHPAALARRSREPDPTGSCPRAQPLPTCQVYHTPSLTGLFNPAPCLRPMPAWRGGWSNWRWGRGGTHQGGGVADIFT